MTTGRYRQLARDAVNRAKIELDSSDDNRLRYAALELRTAIECLTYERVLHYERELPKETFLQWKPDKLMKLLKDLDPKLRQGGSSVISYTRHRVENGERIDDPKRVLGEYHTLSWPGFSSRYNALGNFLHAPDFGNIARSNVDRIVKMKSTCQKTFAIIHKVAFCRIFNFSVGPMSILPECMNSDCRAPVARRWYDDMLQADAKCINCGADYVVEVTKTEATYRWYPMRQQVPCSNEQCDVTREIWDHQLRHGFDWTCETCGAESIIELSVGPKRQ